MKSCRPPSIHFTTHFSHFHLPILSFIDVWRIALLNRGCFLNAVTLPYSKLSSRYTQEKEALKLYRNFHRTIETLKAVGEFICRMAPRIVSQYFMPSCRLESRGAAVSVPIEEGSGLINCARI